MDAIAAELGLDRAEVRERNLIQPDEMPYDHGLMFQDGRPLIYDSGDFPATLAKLKKLVGLGRVRRRTATPPAAEGRRVGIGLACYVEGTGVGPYEGAHVRVETTGKVVRRHRADHPGPGPRDGVRADRRRGAGRAGRRRDA